MPVNSILRYNIPKHYDQCGTGYFVTQTAIGHYEWIKFHWKSLETNDGMRTTIRNTPKTRLAPTGLSHACYRDIPLDHQDCSVHYGSSIDTPMPLKTRNMMNARLMKPTDIWASATLCGQLGETLSIITQEDKFQRATSLFLLWPLERPEPWCWVCIYWICRLIDLVRLPFLREMASSDAWWRCAFPWNPIMN